MFIIKLLLFFCIFETTLYFLNLVKYLKKKHEFFFFVKVVLNVQSKVYGNLNRIILDVSYVYWNNRMSNKLFTQFSSAKINQQF